MTRVITRLEVAEGEVLPWYLAPAFIRWECNSTVCYPLGWHLVVRYARRFWIWFRRLGFDGEIRRGHDERVLVTTAFNRGYDKGHEAGYRKGAADGRRVGQDEVYDKLLGGMQN